MSQQQIVEALYELGVVTHSDLSDSQSGCVRINTLQELLEAIECVSHLTNQAEIKNAFVAGATTVSDNCSNACDTWTSEQIEAAAKVFMADLR